MERVSWSYTAQVPLPKQSVDTARPPEDLAMLTTATTEVMRLVSTLARRIDAGLVESAVRNAEASVLAAHQRWLDEMATLSDLYAIEGLNGDEPIVPAPRIPELIGVS